MLIQPLYWPQCTDIKSFCSIFQNKNEAKVLQETLVKKTNSRDKNILQVCTKKYNLGWYPVGYNLCNWMHSGANPTISTARVLWKIPRSGMFSIKAVYSTMKFKAHSQNDSALFLCSVPAGFVWINQIFIHIHFPAEHVEVIFFNLFILILLIFTDYTYPAVTFILSSTRMNWHRVRMYWKISNEWTAFDWSSDFSNCMWGSKCVSSLSQAVMREKHFPGWGSVRNTNTR